ncbi:hypothetical protein T4E_11226 [Trichinella pseudospiralis]|uniref:Uncharacterized protein n=1 Tax=Trichinella pseudospiralis TaxID=6337 RepID=A0A0V0YEB5_TRIPS|nr:hypothetical protein T4E_11226 [Trichinella pseudospiralis]
MSCLTTVRIVYYQNRQLTTICFEQQLHPFQIRFSSDISSSNRKKTIFGWMVIHSKSLASSFINPLCSKYRNRVTVYRGCLSFCQKIRIIELNQYLSNYSENNFIVIGQLNTDHYSHLNETKQVKVSQLLMKY